MSAVFDYVETCAELARTGANLSMNLDTDGDYEVYGYPLPPGLAQVVHLAISFLGFLEAAAKDAGFFNANEQIRLIETIKDIFSDKFMTALEAAFSTLRNAKGLEFEVKDWKRWMKHYAAIGRPLGGMLLRQAFMAFVCSCASLRTIPPDAVGDEDVLDMLQSRKRLQTVRNASSSSEILESIADIAADEYAMIEAGSDYLQLGSAWQHRLAFRVKAYALESFLYCSLLQEDAADPELLLTWLESTLADPVQMADEVLATTALKSLAILGQTSHTTASNLSRSLPRYMVQGCFDTRLALVAANTLSRILNVLPGDTTITTLYSLGNVLSATSGADRIGNPTAFNAGMARANQGINGTKQQPTGSSISIELSELGDSSVMYGTVIQIIVGVASKSQDEKMIALAQSMLVQKIGRVNIAVDAKIITEVATLSIYGGLLEFRSLLKLYSKLSHDAVVEQNQLLSNAVSQSE